MMEHEEKLKLAKEQLKTAGYDSDDSFQCSNYKNAYNGIHYTLHGDYYFPDIIGPKDDPRPIGKWGRMHKRYLREHRPVLYNQLVLQGKLSTYLADLNEQAQERLAVLIRQIQRTEGIDELLKAKHQMEWVGRMNSIRQRAEETILAEIVFA